MIRPYEEPSAREIARVLVDALERVIGPSAEATAIAAARDAAQLLGLEGLDRVLAVCEPHAGRPWPAELGPVLERIRRLAAAASASGSLEGFPAAQAELLALSRQIQAIEWSEPAEAAEGLRGAIPTLGLDRVLEDLPLAAGESLTAHESVRLTAPVAAALRASLDWLTQDAGSRTPITIRTGESTLEIQCERVSHHGLKIASEVLAAAGGHLGPLPGAGPEPHFAGPWVIRVPRFSARKTYLMLIQGDLKLALPWHAVLRLRMVPAREIQPHSRVLGAPALEPLVPLARSGAEHPVALIAHGLKRASFVADRLVWRLEAQPAETFGAPPLAGLSRAVETDAGETYWLAEPGWLLERVPIPVIPAWEPPPPPRVETGPPILGPEHVEPLVAPPAPRVEEPREEVTTITAPEPIVEVPGVNATTPEVEIPVPPTPETAPDAEASTEASATIETSVPIAEAPDTATREPAAPLQNSSADEPDAPEILEGPEAPVVRERIEPTARPDLTVVAPRRPMGAESGAKPMSPPRALIAEDSIAARIFLSRLLEQQGIMVRAVATGEELFAELYDETWSLVCVDVELPDAAGVEFLRAVVTRVEQFESAVPLVALVRDAPDVAAATAAGIRRSLRKPYERDALVQALSRLGLGAGRTG